jgi:hypothetical protein
MTGASCRNEGCAEPRRIRRGAVDPLCEDCYRQALRRVAAELAGEQHPGRAKQRFKRFENNPGQQRTGERQPSRGGAPAGPRLISEALLAEAHRRYEQDQRPLGEIAAALIERTGYANPRSAEMALRAQFKRRGWRLRSRREAAAVRAQQAP